MDGATEVMAAAAATVLQQMALDGWNTARDRFAAFLARRRGTAVDRVAAELDSTRAELTAARASGDDAAPDELRRDLAGRFRRAVQGDDEAQRELAGLVAEFRVEQTQTQIRDVHNTISGGTQHGPVIQAGSVGRVEFGEQP
ncbi:hypothetical protein [Streptomyces sp. 8L]|uniref:hypothetical protein n=1 Tax=Streptomyces sp. 8L TaxID=2877242 RepID=UPI001CD19C2E|nr:hypothetical protein [Streptomyces sp. 8L]MCA1223245.1 hypothetical protein [Streptomyces sp. 8L]